MKPEFVAVNSIITWQPMMKADNNTVRLQNMIVITAASPNQIAAMIEALPEFDIKNSCDDISSRIAGRQHSMVIALSQGADAGFMVCYEDDDGFYYNWIMGVLPPFRKVGIGRALIGHFAESAVLANLPLIKVKTMNRYRSMLRLLIDCGFDIMAIADGKITFKSAAQKVAGADALTHAALDVRRTGDGNMIT